ncbi:hypothetical protein JYU34_004660 [Plutella xylostella]|uniref:Uncharacterized protein n=1 Tax=Plutella xylostella TaxID=51655 RepID=A0ABQ7QYL4_PLUXY|nr:hypothetical protein JYU34_004660 [Plutella xylostella]
MGIQQSFYAVSDLFRVRKSTSGPNVDYKTIKGEVKSQSSKIVINVGRPSWAHLTKQLLG